MRSERDGIRALQQKTGREAHVEAAFDLTSVGKISQRGFVQCDVHGVWFGEDNALQYHIELRRLGGSPVEMGDLNGLIDGSGRNDRSKEIVAIRGGQRREVSRTGREFYREREAGGRLIRASRWRQAINADSPRIL